MVSILGRTLNKHTGSWQGKVSKDGQNIWPDPDRPVDPLRFGSPFCHGRSVSNPLLPPTRDIPGHHIRIISQSDVTLQRLGVGIALYVELSSKALNFQIGFDVHEGSLDGLYLLSLVLKISRFQKCLSFNLFFQVGDGQWFPIERRA